ncbi:hypothetical protein KJ854_05645 [Patescibacteria group bacterium]|nr:hypothetical protein [Patescibacteria group bacterium]
MIKRKVAIVAALLAIGAIIVALEPQELAPVNSLDGITVKGLSGGVVAIPEELSIYTLGNLKADTAYTQYWPNGKFSGGFDQKNARNIYFIAEKNNLNNIEIKSPEIAVSGLNSEKAWGYERLFANVTVLSGQFVDIRTNKINAPNDRIDLYKSQYADFSESANGFVLFDEKSNEKNYYFVTITAIDKG